MRIIKMLKNLVLLHFYFFMLNYMMYQSSDVLTKSSQIHFIYLKVKEAGSHRYKKTDSEVIS